MGAMAHLTPQPMGTTTALKNVVNSAISLKIHKFPYRIRCRCIDIVNMMLKRETTGTGTDQKNTWFNPSVEEGASACLKRELRCIQLSTSPSTLSSR